MADLSVREVAERARTSDRTVRRWIAEGKLTATRSADGWTIAESDLVVMLDGRPSPDNGHSESVRLQNGHVDGRPPGRPSAIIEAPLLAQLLADTQAELVRTAAAAAMWQARAEHLQAQLDHALPAASPERPSGSPTDHAVAEPTQSPTTTASRTPWWAFWRSSPA